jgi:hypothetical protein
MQRGGPRIGRGGGRTIEFTISRAALCICGVVLLASVSGIMGSYKDSTEAGMEDSLAEDVAEMLDAFWSSE